MFIIISGPIGVGKSTATRIYAQITGFKPLFETVEGHPYLEKFYKDPKTYSFRTQAFFMWDRFNKHYTTAQSGIDVIADRSIYEDGVFAKVLNLRGEMDDDDYFKTYKPHFDLLTNILPPPDLMIYLHADLEVILNRIRKRARDMEKDIDVDYLRMLQEQYEEWIKVYPHKKLLVDTGSLDLTCDLHPEWYLFFKAIHQKVLNDDLPNEPVSLSKILSDMPMVPSTNKSNEAEKKIFAHI